MINTTFFVTTRGRPNDQRTLNNLHPHILRRTKLVVDHHEYEGHKKYNNIVSEVITMPKGYGNFIIDGSGCLSDKRQWCLENCNTKWFFLLDDDLTFQKRIGGKLKNIEAKDTFDMFRTLHGWLKSGINHVALSAREGNNRIEEDFASNSRAMRVVGYNTGLLKELGFKFNEILLMSDFHATLTLLKDGQPNRILYTYANGHRGSNAKGGCSLYRSPRTMRESAEKLSQLHLKFIKIEEKTTAKPWAGFKTNKRTDVTISWKKAFEYGKGKRRGIGGFL